MRGPRGPRSRPGSAKVGRSASGRGPRLQPGTEEWSGARVSPGVRNVSFRAQVKSPENSEQVRCDLPWLRNPARSRHRLGRCSVTRRHCRGRRRSHRPVSQPPPRSGARPHVTWQPDDSAAAPLLPAGAVTFCSGAGINSATRYFCCEKILA